MRLILNKKSDLRQLKTLMQTIRNTNFNRWATNETQSQQGVGAVNNCRTLTHIYTYIGV